MAAVVRWSALAAIIEPTYPKVGPQGGRRPFSIAVMLRIDCLQQWYSLSDPGAEEALSTSNRCVRSVISNLAATRSPTRRRF